MNVELTYRNKVNLNKRNIHTKHEEIFKYTQEKK
jgi:hypothetical protein